LQLCFHNPNIGEDIRDIYDYLKKIEQIILHNDWPGLEAFATELAISLAGEKIANEIAKINFDSYQDQLHEALQQAISIAKKQKAFAVYFEYDFDNDWQSHFFICQDYVAREQAEQEGDDWACDYDIKNVVNGPDFSLLSGLYKKNGFFNSTRVAVGSTILLIARTVAAFGRVCEKIACDNIAICIAFHGQDPIFRIKERL